MLPQNIQLIDLLTFFLFVDLIVMLAVGIYSFKTRNKKEKTEQLLEKICSLLSQNPHECAENLTSKSVEKKESTKSQEELVREKLKAINAKTEIKKDAVGENPSENKPKLPSIDQKNVYYEIEESTERNDESSNLILLKNALKDGPVIKPLLKMPNYIEELITRSRQSETPHSETEVAASAKPTIPLLPPPPPPVPTQTTNTKNNEQKEEAEK